MMIALAAPLFARVVVGAKPAWASARCDAAWREGGVRLPVEDLKAFYCPRRPPAAAPSDGWHVRGLPDDGSAARVGITIGEWPSTEVHLWTAEGRSAEAWLTRWLAEHYREAAMPAVHEGGMPPCPPPWSSVCLALQRRLRVGAQSDNDRGADLDGLCAADRPDHDLRYAGGLGMRMVEAMAADAAAAADARRRFVEASLAAGWDGEIPWLRPPAESSTGIDVRFSQTRSAHGRLTAAFQSTLHDVRLPTAWLWFEGWPDAWSTTASCGWTRDAGLWGRRREESSLEIETELDGRDPARFLLAWQIGVGPERTVRRRISLSDWQRLLAFARRLRPAPPGTSPAVRPAEHWPRLRWLSVSAEQAAVIVSRRASFDPLPLAEAFAHLHAEALAERWSEWRRQGPLERAVLLAGGLGGEGLWAGLPCGGAALADLLALTPGRAEPRRRLGRACADIWQDLLREGRPRLEQAIADLIDFDGFLVVVDRGPNTLQATRWVLPRGRELGTALADALWSFAAPTNPRREDLTRPIFERAIRNDGALLAQLGHSGPRVEAVEAVWSARAGASSLRWFRWRSAGQPAAPDRLQAGARIWKRPVDHAPPSPPRWPAGWLEPPQWPTGSPAPNSTGVYRDDRGGILVHWKGRTTEMYDHVLIFEQP